MNTGQHTPGHWQILPEEAGKAYIRIRGTRIGTTFKIANVLVHTYPGAGDRELIEARYNARLIAAAPDLLEALRRIAQTKPVHGLNPSARMSDPDNVKVGWNVHWMAQAAIAKAQGVDADVVGEAP